MIHGNWGKKVLAGSYLLLMLAVCLKSNSFGSLREIGSFLKQQMFASMETVSDGLSMETIKADYTDSVWQKQRLINLNGFMARSLNIRGQYSDIGMYVTDNSYVVVTYPETSTDYEVEQVVRLKEFLDEQEVNLLYVNQPVKYLDDSLLAEEFGVESYSNRNADLFLERIREAGVDTIDLREELQEDSMDICDMFYRTDHHWTTETGLWATRKIAEGLNEYYGYDIDLSIYDEENYTFTSWEDCWLGEQGRKIAQTYVGLDDFTLIKPKFPVSISIKKDGEYIPGTFDDLINESRYVTEGMDPSDAPSWYYSYQTKKTRNENVENGKVLVLMDSYGHVILPFLSLSVEEVDYRILRRSDVNLQRLIKKGGYDTVIIAYAQFMIGAHDTEGSANYRMFTFFDEEQE